MGSRERRLRERQDLRTLILDTARDLFVAEGYDAVTMRRIAERIDYSPTAIYFHFKNKSALIDELCDHDFMALEQQFAGIERIADPIEKLRRAAHLYVQFGLANRSLYRLMFMTPRPRSNSEEPAYSFLKSIVAQAVEQGLLLRDLRDPELIAQTVWAGMHGVVALEIAKRDEESIAWRPPDARGALMIDALIDGLSAKTK